MSPRKDLAPPATVPASLTLLIPELLWSEPADANGYAASTPALERLLSWARCERHPRGSVEDALFERLGSGQAPPPSVAAVRLAGEDVVPPRVDGHRVFCADPVHLHFHKDRLLIADAGVVRPTADDAAELTAALNEHFAPDAQFIAATPARWYVFVPPDSALSPAAAPAPLSTVVGRQLPLSAFGKDAAFRKLANQIQMVLHPHPVNARREAAGAKTLNALWLWGSSVTPRQAPGQCVWSDQPLARGLARLAGHASRPAPATVSPLLAASESGAQFAWLDALDDASRYQDSAAHGRALAALETDWFVPLLAALRRRQLAQLCLVAPTAYGQLCWHIAPPGLWQRRPWAPAGKSLAQWAATLAAHPLERTP